MRVKNGELQSCHVTKAACVVVSRDKNYKAQQNQIPEDPKIEKNKSRLLA